MKRIVIAPIPTPVNIWCTDKYCECDIYNTYCPYYVPPGYKLEWICKLFNVELQTEKTGNYSFSILRCEECLEAEKKEKI
jgi:hypothetical protein